MMFGVNFLFLLINRNLVLRKTRKKNYFSGVFCKNNLNNY